MIQITAQMKVRRDTAANWTAEDPTPAEGEWCLETDTGQVKMGDGVTAWTSLPYFAGSGSGITQLTGDVTAGPGSGSQAATIPSDTVTNAKLANMVQASFKGRAAAAGTGDPTDLTANEASTILDGATDPFLRTSAAPTGDVVGPASSVSARIATFDGVTGKLIQDSGKTIASLLPVQVTSLTLVDSSWTLVSGLYEYDLANANITATSIVEVIPDNADIDIVIAAEVLPRTDSGAGTVKLYAKNLPTDDIGVTINIYPTT